MLKKSYIKIVSLCFVTMTLSSCSFFGSFFKTESTEKTPPIKVTDKIDVFSAITYFIDKKEYDIEEFNYANAYVKTGYLIYMKTVRAKLFLEVTDSGYLDVDFKDCQSQEGELIGGKVYYNWKNSNLYYDQLIPIRNKFISDIDSLLSDSASLNICKDHFLTSFKYTYLVLKSLTEVGREKFINEHYVNRNFAWSLPLIDFQFNKNSRYQKKYVALFRCSIDDESDLLFNKLFSNRIYISVYTDNDSLADINKQQEIKYSAKLVNIDQSFASENFNFDFVE